jgi:hypothetical protein
MNFESARMKALKLLALASRGVGGEADNARKMLEAHCTRHGIDGATLADCERSTRQLLIVIKNPAWKPKRDMKLAQLAVQSLRYIRGIANLPIGACRSVQYIHRASDKARPRKYTVYAVEAEATLAEWEDCRSCFDHYAPDFWKMQMLLEHRKREIAAAIKRSVNVFINEHDLFPPDAGTKGSLPTPEEIAAYRAAAAAVTGDKWIRPAGRLQTANYYLE